MRFRIINAMIQMTQETRNQMNREVEEVEREMENEQQPTKEGLLSSKQKLQKMMLLAEASSITDDTNYLELFYVEAQRLGPVTENDMYELDEIEVTQYLISKNNIEAKFYAPKQLDFLN